jgi:hypothetical protein
MLLKIAILIQVELNKPKLLQGVKVDSNFLLKEGKQLVEPLSLSKHSLPNKDSPSQDRVKHNLQVSQ